jgi:hypothetical protein
MSPETASMLPLLLLQHKIQEKISKVTSMKYRTLSHLTENSEGSNNNRLRSDSVFDPTLEREK